MSKKTKRAPRAFSPEDAKVVSREKETFDDPELAEIAPPDTLNVGGSSRADNIARGIKWGALFATTLGSLVLLAAGLWINDLVAGLLAREDWIGWLALGLLGLTVLSAIMLAAREALAIMRLKRLGRIRQDAESALRQKEKPLAEAIATKIRAQYHARPELAWGQARLADHELDIMDARETLSLLERELITPLDQDARSAIAATAKRVSVVTAISPVATLDMAIVAIQNLRMLRRIATVYGVRPGTFALLRLARMVVTHIVVTGGLALGDDVIQQLIGHRLMAKLSARLGEGLFNGALTARIGLAAVEVCRPLPFIEVQPPRFRTLLAEIARQASVKS